MAFFAYAGGRGSTTAMIVANRGQRKEKSFYRTSRISGFSVARSTSTNVLPLQSPKISQVTPSTRRERLGRSTEILFNSESKIVDLLENKTADVERTRKVSLSPESLERLAWFSSYSSDEELSVCDLDDECADGTDQVTEDCETTVVRKLEVNGTFGKETSTAVDSVTEVLEQAAITADVPIKREYRNDSEVSTDSSASVDTVSLAESESEHVVVRVADDTEEVSDTTMSTKQKPIQSIVDESSKVYRSRFNSREDWIDDEEEEEVTDEETEEEEAGQTLARANHDFCDIHRHEHIESMHVQSQAKPEKQVSSTKDKSVASEEASAQVTGAQEPSYSMISIDLCEQLTSDINTMVDWVDTQHQDSAFVREENARLLKTCIQSVLGQGVNLIEYGSSGVGLALPDSDLDFVIVLEKRSNAFNLARPQQLESLTKVLEVLKTQAWVNNINFISTAGIPVIKFSGFGGRPIDLSCLGALHQGLRTQHFIEDELNAKPHLRPLVLVLKQLVRDNGLADTASGGVSSYGLLLIVSCFLSWHMQMTHDFGNNSFSVGWMLLAFLEQHATLLDYTAVVFTVHGYEARSHVWSHFAHDMIAVSDPFDDQRNVTRALYRLSHFHMVLRNFWSSLSHGKPLSSVINTKPVSVLSSQLLPHTSWVKPQAQIDQ